MVHAMRRKATVHRYSACFKTFPSLAAFQPILRRPNYAHSSSYPSKSVAEPQNITRFAIYPPAIPAKGGSVTIAGVPISLPVADVDESRPLLFEKQEGSWICRGALDTKSLNGKRPGLQGPMDDAFAKPFLCVRGTGKAWNPEVASWADANLNRFADEWRRHYQGYLPMKNDTEVTEDDVRHSNLILFGDPASNLNRVLLNRIFLRTHSGSDICNEFLDEHERRMKDGESRPRTFGNYTRRAESFVKR